MSPTCVESNTLLDRVFKSGLLIFYIVSQIKIFCLDIFEVIRRVLEGIA